MASEFEKVRRLIWSYIVSHREFKFSDLLRVVNETGVARVAPNCTIRDYLEDLELLGYVKDVGAGRYISNICKKL